MRSAVFQWSSHIDTSQLICSAYQSSGFYMREPLQGQFRNSHGGFLQKRALKNFEKFASK